MVEKILQHRHCISCGKAVPVDEEYVRQILSQVCW